MRPRPPLPALVLSLGLAACGGGKPFEVSDAIYTAPGDPAAVRQLVAERAVQCWPGADERLRGLSVAAIDLDGTPAIVLARPPAEGAEARPEDTVFTVRFRSVSDRRTDLVFAARPEDEALARKLKDDVLLWANGTRACA